MNFGKSSSDKQIYLHTITFIVSTKDFSVGDLLDAKSDTFSVIKIVLLKEFLYVGYTFGRFC